MSAPIPRPVVRGELPGINLPRILTHGPLRPQVPRLSWQYYITFLSDLYVTWAQGHHPRCQNATRTVVVGQRGWAVNCLRAG